MTYAYQPQQQTWQPMWQPTYGRTSAPVSLHVVAVFQYLTGLLTLAVATLLGLTAAGVVPGLEYASAESTWSTRQADVTAVAAVVCAVLAVTGLTAIVLGRKVQRGRNWARIVLTGLNLFSVAGVAWQWYAGIATPEAALAATAFPALFLILLNTRAARRWCRYRTY